MTLTLDLPPELQSRLQEEAARRGLNVEQCARMLLEDRLASQESAGRDRSAGQEPADVDEWLRRFDELVASFRDLKAPDIPPEALRRENLDEDRGL